MKRQIFKSIFLTALVSTLLMSFLIFIVMYGQFNDEVKKAVRAEAGVIKAGYGVTGAAFLKALPADGAYRVTLIDPGGAVLYDSDGLEGAMDNHADRPEVIDARRTGAGEAVRASATIGEQTYYYAVLLADGTVLRVASTTDNVLAAVLACLPYTGLGIIGIALLSAAAAVRRTRRIIRPVNNIDLDAPLSNDVYEELAPLLTRIERQHREINEKAAALSKKQDEFTAITGSMSEGMVLLGADGKILSMNESAQRLYGLDKSVVGLDFLEIDRSVSLQKIIGTALEGGRGEALKDISGRTYQYLASPMLSSGRVSGVILLIIDETERLRAEQQRREFTANVSHELKTPLQSIMGSAELIANGLVRPEDTRRFMERIYQEARRLVEMVDDIIRLSQLDEMKGEMPWEAVDLTALVREVAEQLSDAARSREVAIQVRGGPARVQGVYRLVWEIVYNLCDNAVKYNRKGGRVDITVKADLAGVELTVADTGIGIPREDQGRVFERFYRVDKSHSRDTGGTGLGLSIVKHAAQHLGAAVSLSSEENKGTVISVRFPKRA
jgi:two-component system phosphate regulon sensor histidine kinase PhoR